MSKKISCLLMSLTVHLCALSAATVYASEDPSITASFVYDSLPKRIQFVGAGLTHGWGVELPLSLRTQALVLNNSFDDEKMRDVLTTSTLFALDAFWPQAFPELTSFNSGVAEDVEEKLNSWLANFDNIVVMTLPELDQIDEPQMDYLKSSKGKRLNSVIKAFLKGEATSAVSSVNQVIRGFKQDNPEGVHLYEFSEVIDQLVISQANSRDLFTAKGNLSELGQRIVINLVVVPSIKEIYEFERFKVSMISGVDSVERVQEELTAQSFSWNKGFNGYYKMDWLTTEEQVFSDLDIVVPRVKHEEKQTLLDLRIKKSNPLVKASITNEQIKSLSRIANHISENGLVQNQEFFVELIGERLILHLKDTPGFPESIELKYDSAIEAFVGWSTQEWSKLMDEDKFWASLSPSKISFSNIRFEAQLNTNSHAKLRLKIAVVPQATSHGFTQPITEGSSMSLAARWQQHLENSYKFYPRLEYKLEANIH